MEKNLFRKIAVVSKYPFIYTIKSWFSRFSIQKLVDFLPLKVKKQPLKLPAPSDFSDGEPSKQNQSHSCPNYMQLKMSFRDIGRMNGIIESLGRDFLTAMPEGAYKSRLGQIAFLSRRLHEDLANKELAVQIEKASAHQQKHKKQWDEWDVANLVEMERMYRSNCHIDPDLIEKSARLSYEGRRHHRDVMKNNDWGSAKVFLQQMIDHKRKIAEAKGLGHGKHETDPEYQALIQDYIPGAQLDDIDSLFADFKTGLDKLLPKILEKQKNEPDPIPLKGPFSSDLQLWLNKSLLQKFGFDFGRGGLYETGHNPVEGGTPDDTRLVIKNSGTENFLESMKSTLHEGGHGLYIQGLPRTEWRYQPVGQDLGAAVHESQALLIEMIIGRMPEFFHYLSPRVEGLFQKFGEEFMSAENLYALKTRVNPKADRRNADEVTYFYHIRMRMKLERDMISGRLAVSDLPDAWNALTKEFTGKEPETYAHGCLQDVHWFVGKIGYYPSYALGHMMAAQINDCMKRDIQNLPELVANGQFTSIRDWLGTNIHSKGRSVNADKLIKDLTGAALSPNPLLNHFEDRYLNAA